MRLQVPELRQRFVKPVNAIICFPLLGSVRCRAVYVPFNMHATIVPKVAAVTLPQFRIGDFSAAYASNV